MITNNKNLGEFFFFQWGEIKILFLKLEGTFPSLPLHLQISQKALPAMQEKVCVVQASEPLAVSWWAWGQPPRPQRGVQREASSWGTAVRLTLGDSTHFAR